MLRKLIALVALALPLPLHATTYFFANAGSDANSGLSSATPMKTIGEMNTLLATAKAGDSFLLQRGDVFSDATIQCKNVVTSAAGWTTADHPPTCSGADGSPILISSYGSVVVRSPVIDGADSLALTWTAVSGAAGTYQATLSGTMPSKLYVDGATTETAQLLPVPNVVGAYSATATYQPYDAVTSGGLLYIRGPLPASSGVAVTVPSVWVDITNPVGGNTSQSFSTTNSGLANVEATPGSWYGAGSTIYVHLADGSNPSRHTLEGTRRTYGVLLEGVNYVTVSGLLIEHTAQSGIAAIDYPYDYGTYFTGEYLSILNNQVFNYGSIVVDSLNIGGHYNHLAAGILVRTNGQYSPHLLRGEQVLGNTIGTADPYFGVYYGQVAAYQAGIFMSGIDGGGTANQQVMAGNYIRTVNAAGAHFDTTDLYSSSGPLRNNGGSVINNEFTNCQGNLYFTATAGGLEAHNKIHDSFGEGVQTGGQSTSTDAAPQFHSYDLIYNLGKGASGAIYNGFDCNGDGTTSSGLNFTHDTVASVWGAAITLEGNAASKVGCPMAHVHDNIFDQNAPYFPNTGAANLSNGMYFVDAVRGVGPEDFSHNLWMLSPGQNTVAHGDSTSFGSCAAYLSGWPDTNSICGTDPGFVNLAAGDFHLSANSPARGAASDGSDIGALPYIVLYQQRFSNVHLSGNVQR